MAKFELNPSARPTGQAYRPERVRIGSISVFALVVIICLAVLAVLAFSTANASLTMAQRQATATTELYLDEMAAQEFVAGMDELLASVRTAAPASAAQATSAAATEDDASGAQLLRDESGNVAFDENGYQVVVEPQQGRDKSGEEGLKLIKAHLAELEARASQAAQEAVQVSAEVNGSKVEGRFTCQNGRLLTIVVTVRDNGTYRIDRWKMSAVQNEEEPEGQLLILDE